MPAHAAMRGGAQPTQLYGAYGQPLPATQPPPDPYVPRNAPQPYPPIGPPAGYPYVSAPPPLDTSNGTHSRKRQHDEPHTPTLPPPGRGEPAYSYPDPTTLAPGPGGVPLAEHSPYPTQANMAPQPYYTAPPSAAGHTQSTLARRPSPSSSAYSYEQGRSSSSPRNQAAAGTPYGAPQETLRPPSNAPSSRTPPPTTGANGRPAMSISSMMSNQQRNSGSTNGEGASPGAARHPTDSDMLNKLR